MTGICIRREYRVSAHMFASSSLSTASRTLKDSGGYTKSKVNDAEVIACDAPVGGLPTRAQCQCRRTGCVVG
ncbi:hypothetical protein X949_4267 [Burkholderia pseudomallei MSHR5609]|nr:hypothetical protein X949_4267 [Burkholderia pseudomallei MSHR5609]